MQEWIFCKSGEFMPEETTDSLEMDLMRLSCGCLPFSEGADGVCGGARTVVTESVSLDIL